jgi:Cu(I)-responsive transcriptional regulator
MNIGAAARQSGVSAKMIRYYEQSGLIPQATRLQSGYRDYVDNDVHRLRFVRRARDLGFSVEQIADLLSLWDDHGRASADVHAMTRAHVERLQAKAAEIQAMIAVLQRLADSCQHDGRPDCPILEELAGDAPLPLPVEHQVERFGAPGQHPRGCAGNGHG